LQVPEVCSVHQAANAAQQLNRLAQRLQSDVSRFKIQAASRFILSEVRHRAGANSLQPG